MSDTMASHFEDEIRKLTQDAAQLREERDRLRDELAGARAYQAAQLKTITTEVTAAVTAERERDKLARERADLLLLAQWFRAEHERTLPVVVAFRRWRNGGVTDHELRDYLTGDIAGRATGLGMCAPLAGLTLLNDACAATPAGKCSLHHPLGIERCWCLEPR